MIQTGFEFRVKVQQIIDNQLPDFILVDNPNASEFLKQYYISQEYQGGPIDIAENLDQYLKVDNLTPEVVVDNTFITSEISPTETVISVNSTKGFPPNYGLLKIDDEIITYTGLTTNTFNGCIRGFSGITSYHSNLNQEQLIFSESTSTTHANGSSVQNLSSLFLKEFYKKIKYTFTPGLENVDFVSNLNVGNFIKEARSFYQSKGTDESFRILFNILYGITPKVVNLEEFLIKPSSAEYIRREVVIAERISGDPSKLVGQTIKKSTDETTSASISEVEIFTRNNIQYYKILLFVGYNDTSAIEGNFTITPNTKCLENISIGSSVISVDSTIGFPEEGKIISGSNVINYTSKSINQFFGCSGIQEEISLADNIRSDEIYYGYEDGDITKKVELRFTGVLSKFERVSDTLTLDEGEIITIKNIGDVIKNPDKNKTYKEIFANSWIYNTSSRYQIKDINNYTLSSPIDRSSLKIGDVVEIVERDSNIVASSPTSVAYISGIEVEENRVILNDLIFEPYPGIKYDIRRKLNTANSVTVPIEFGNNVILSDVQNLYTDDDKYAYVASNSLPSGRDGYTGNYTYKITKNIKSINATALSNIIDDKYTTILFANEVPFITGDRVYYQPSDETIVGLDTGDYYVQVQDQNNEIRLYSSKTFIGTNDYLTFFESDFTAGKIHNFTIFSQKSGIIKPKKLLKKFPLSENIKNGTGELTTPGKTGMLINGVEISNYKSDDKIYYGPLKSVNVLNGGVGYDVINPPLITVSPGVGGTALLQPVISGSIKKVYVDSQDYDIDKIVSIGVSGGNGSGCIIEPIVVKRQRSILFDGRDVTNSGGISTTTNQVTFLTDHNLNDGESIIYNSNGNLGIGIGTTSSTLINNAVYYIKIDNSKTVKLYQSNSDYLSGINTVTFNGNNTTGIHKFVTSTYKNTVSEIKIINGGSGYTNRKLIVSPSGISTINHSINFENHGFNDGELLQYSYETSTIGISTLSQYYVLKNDDNSFRLCDAGIGGTNISNYIRKNYIKFSSFGSGYQYFKYPDITVSIQYTPVGFGTTSQEYKSLVTTPVATGAITKIYLYESGSGYGSKILNLEKKPLITIKTGREAKLKPIITNGIISLVNIQYGGVEYYSNPNLIVIDESGGGTGADLRPVIVNGKIVDVKIISGGIGYSKEYTKIIVNSSGSGAVLESKIRSLVVNNNSKFGNEIISETNNQLQYSVSGYFNELRTAFNDVGGSISKIIGWAYDGNPIYGPYGYTDPNNESSPPKRLNSGYVLNTSNVYDRPTDFPPGFFVEDYQYTNSGDLDENNGRFGRTEEFPEGVYAYFATVDSFLNPQFPYFIGNRYRSNTLQENLILDQSYDFNNSNLLRNTFPYKIYDNYSSNDFIINSNDTIKQQSVVESVSDGYVDNIEIINSGVDYKVNDVINFNDNNIEGGGLIAKVSSIKGKNIEELNTSVDTYTNAIFTKVNNNEVKVTILPNHNLSDNDFVVISGFSTNLSKLNGSYTINVPSYYSNVLKDIPSSTSGLSTEIYVTQLPESVSIGSSIIIGTETLSILEIFKNLNILKVKRGSTGVSHTATTQINFIPDSFTISKNIDYFESKVNDIVYFNPKQSIGIGTTSGITNPISFEFGDFNITRSIPTQGIYIENHPFSNNQQVIFTNPIPGGGGGSNISISTSPTGGQFDLPQTVYITNKNKNTIGIRTNLNSSDVYFITNGIDNDEYSLKSVYTQQIGSVKKIKSTVSVSTYHGLTNGDNITLNVNPNLSVGIGTSTSIYVKRDSITGNILINPIVFNSTGINTTNNKITINSHKLKTGDKVLYSANVVASGLTTGFYYIYRIDDNNINLCLTYLDSKSNPPTLVSIASTGGPNHTISLINPQIKSVKNNNLVFNLSDTSLNGYNFKLYYDKDYNNEFISTPTLDSFTLSGVGTVGVSSVATLTINYNDSLPTQLFYNLEKSGHISTSDTSVNNYSEILFVNSLYNSNYSVSGVGSTTFSICLTIEPEKLKYTQNECDTLIYSTNSLSAKGPIDKVNIVSGGSGYKKLPTLAGFDTIEGKNAYLFAKSRTIGNEKEVRIIDEGFEYPADKTLQPNAYISPLITVKNSNTINKVDVVFGGKGYISAPSIIIVDSTTGEKINSGILEAVISANSINSINVIKDPKGIPDSSVNIFTENNTNGISIQKVQSNSTGIFTCFITTPTNNFTVQPFNIGDKVFVEGIVKYSIDGSGFNSSEYGYEFFTVTDYDNTGVLDSVTINISGLTTNTGIAKTIQDSFGNIIKETDYPSFKFTQVPSLFTIGEEIISNNSVVDLKIISSNDTFIKVAGSYELGEGEIITGKESGNIATIDKIKNNFGRFKVNYSVEKNIGWNNDIGKLDEDNQVVQDNDYYQNLSYTIKSPITYQELKTPVNSLVHTSGLKNFSDTGITSITNTNFLISENFSTIVYEAIEEHRVDTIYDFDLVQDIDTVNNSSKFLKLKNKKLTDYIECSSNVVLKIDDISKQFSNLDGNPSEILKIKQIQPEKSYDNMIVRVSSSDNSQIQLSELVLLNDSKNYFFGEKAKLINSGIGLTHSFGEQFGVFDVITDEYDETFLTFIPNDPFNIDYDVKLISSNFNSISAGIGTTSIGFINLVGVNASASSGVTTSIISINSNKLTSLYANVQIVDSITNQMNFVEVYLNHDGTNTYISEYYFDSEDITNFYSGNFIGTFGADISSGILSLNYKNNSSNDVKIRSKIVGFGTTSPSIGVGTYRFILTGQIPGNERSAIYEANYKSTVSAASTVLSLNKSNFNAVKSLVEVSVGSTSALHQIMMIHDEIDVYVQQSPFLSVESTNGIGTFGGEFVGNNFILKFYPDPSITTPIKISSFNQCLYTSIDNINTPPDLKYGKVTESISFSFYNAINGNRINKKQFDLKSDGNPIFVKKFNPSDSTVLDPVTGIFTIKNHYFSPNEKLIYTPKSTFIGIGETAVGIGITLNSVGVLTTLLPSDVYVIKISDDKFKLSTRPDYAQLGIGVTFTSYGEGNLHELEMFKKNEKVIITIDNLVQYPLLFTPIAHNLYGNGGQISAGSSIFALSGISSIFVENIVKIDNEYMNVINVGLGTTNVGPITNTGDINLIQVTRGFVGSSSTVHTDSTEVRVYKGSYNIVNNSIFFTEAPRGNPQIERDSGNLLFETSDFTGRVFLRNDYTTNKIYDDISDQFTGIGRTFTLTVGGANTIGLGSTGGNGVLFINSIFQTPSTLNNPENNFKIIENSVIGITSVVFSGITDPDTEEIITSELDINQNQTPRGGIIVSLGSSAGLGYAPLVGAQIIPRLNSNGSIVNIVGIATTGSPVAFTTVTYDNQTGILDIFTPSTSALSGIKQVKLVGLGFTCPSGSPGIVSYFPSHNDPLNIIGIGTTSFSVQVGSSTLPHSYVGYGTIYPWYADLNFGSGYNGIVSIGVSVYEKNHVGTAASISASTGIGGTLSFTVVDGGTGYVNPQIFVSEPSYENLEVTGVSRLGIGNTTDTGVGLLVNVEVGASSTTGIGSTYFEVTKFRISRPGYAFKRGDVFKPIGLVTDSRLGSPLSEFEMTVLNTFSDSFAVWQFGEFDYIDSIKNYQDGVRTRFPLYYNEELLSFEFLEGSQVNLSNALLIVINGVIQDPGVAYQFDGGTSFTFSTAPKPEDNVAIFFYRGTIGDDSLLVTNVTSSIEKGDIVQSLKNNAIRGTISQDKRTVFDLSFSDKFETNLYTNQGIDLQNYKPLSWIKKKVDTKINGEDVYKSRDSIESLVYPTSNIIKDFSTTDTQIFVDNAEFFDYESPINFDALIVNGISTNANGAVDSIFDVTLVNGFSGNITAITTAPGANGNPLALKFYINGPIGFSGIQTGYPIYIYDTNTNIGIFTSGFTQVGFLTGSLSETADYFGSAVATNFDGSTIVVGAPKDEFAGLSSVGVAYVYDRVGFGTTSIFNQVGILTGSLAIDLNDDFGSSVAISSDGSTIVVGAPKDEFTGSATGSGVAYVYDRVGLSTFNQVGILTGSLASDLDDGFGSCVAMTRDGSTIIVSAPIDIIAPFRNGAVYVFDRDDNSFDQVGILTGSYTDQPGSTELYGQSLAITDDGSIIVVGAPLDWTPGGAAGDSGIVYIHERVGNSFNEVGILTASNIRNSGDRFGHSVAITGDGSTILVGAYGDETTTGSSNSGLVYVYDRVGVGNSYSEVGILTASRQSTDDRFGYSVAINSDGSTIVVGAENDEPAGGSNNTGLSYVFERVGNSFNQIGILTGSYSTNSDDNFGYSVAISGDGSTIVVGANEDELPVGVTTASGVTYVYNIVSTNIKENGVVSIDNSDASIVGIGTTFLDNIYYIHQFSSSGTVGIATCNILSTTPSIGFSTTGSTSDPVGKYSWGRLSGFSRSSSPISIQVSGNTIDVGLTTFATIQRRGSGIRDTGALIKEL